MKNGEEMDPEMCAVSQEIVEAQTRTLKELGAIWSDMGVHGEAKTARLSAVRTHVLRLFQDMVDEEESNKLIIIQRIEQHLKDLSKLRKELSGDTSCSPDEGLDSAPLYQVEKCLRERWENLQKVKEERIEQLVELQRRLDDVRYRLGKNDSSPYNGGITELELEALKCRVTLHEQERDRLQASFEETQSAIQQIFHDLEMTATFPFDKMVLSTPPNAFVFSPENMAALKKLHQNMEQKLSDAKHDATELRERLSNLWERLQISSHHREDFLHAHRGYSVPTITAFKEELKRCEAIKRENIENFVLQLRREISSWWDRCHFSKSQRSEFRAFYFTDFNEDVLELHELEVKKLKNFYENNRDIFQLADQRAELWEQMHELEKRANDPNRYNNRGGQLLREEKERKTLAKTLPKIEQELRERLVAYEQANYTPFLINGENLLELIDQQNEERHGLKELQKYQKKVNRNHMLEIESKLGTKATTPTSVKRGRLGPATPSMLGSSHKTLTLAPPHSAPQRTLTSKRKAEISPQSNGPTKSNEPSSSKTRRNIMTTLPSDNFSIASGIGPYSEFQNQLELMSAEKACRSSVAPKSYLRELNTPVSNPSSMSSTTKMTLTPGRITTATHLTVTPASLAVTPMKPPRRNNVSATPTPVRRTSTRLNLKSPGIKSPAPGNSARLTTPRSRLPIVF
ncbi:protein regulator of cytokinesis 1-like isoform X2 [Thrips palmi]|uniref:Protein regulator of cytokinesis 1-like isoform X2 n=1 Tax=Thrips palmi TaxID=161013 RepID=A0A6P8YGE5_THRPL|nr:protein regulator of cytokinesis 1-like isoform X2 [Thrips palmi]